MADDGPVHVTVVYSHAPRRFSEWAVRLPAGATVMQALQASGIAAGFPALDLAAASVGVWGRTVNADQALRDGDRVEVYRALRVDPKIARRERFGAQGARATGLFAKKRPGAKPGY